ncbi:hypothetical protein [Thioalkalivibrio paradoxus]|uniref:hypothetical protein n=1 Tax=Thioalkalivibrio paradoxus TaxID=108010 RepID=UPI00022C4A6F|nr:hypothetical protein [Thioalkalivibrio paradoxus]
MSTEGQPENGTIQAWKASRSGAWAGRGFHYQHLISTLILIRQWAGLAPSGFLVPEGLEDCVVELAGRDIWIQIKSRKESTFSSTEVHAILVATHAKAAAVKGTKEKSTAVVLENPRTDYNEASIDQLFTGRARSVIACARPGEECVKVLSRELGTAEVIADGIVSDLYRLVADASQANGFLPFEKRRRISTTEVERRILERLEAEDPSAINRAMASGVIEPVEFENPISEPAFYQGVKVRPGHIAAGLVLDRPDDTGSVIRTLRRQRHVLVSGPSGAGKSAVMWLCAKFLSGELRWYQINPRASFADADSIIRFVRARRPTENSPIGLAFDDVGSSNSDLWNVLVRELRGVPSVYFLGSLRQEDVALIVNKSDTKFIPVSLDEKLAEAVWRKLNAEKRTIWSHWREPYEQSQGLMLEYVHVLTQGQRLAAVIGEQIQQRQQQKRHDELAIIRSTAVLCAHGAEVQARDLFELLGIKPDDASRALSRLIDEHLVKENRPGVLGGLHMLRSQALCNASHDEAALLSADSLWQSLPAVTSDTLPTAVQSILAKVRDEDEGTALRRLAEMLHSSSDVDRWVAILTGLGLATVERCVILFMKLLERHGVQRAQWSLASMFSDPHIDIPDLSQFEQWQGIRNAVLAFRALPKDDLRPACLAHLPKGSVVPSCQNLQQVNKFLSCLAPICGGESVRLTISPDLAGDGEQDIGLVSAVLATAHLVGPDVAENLVQAFGGEEVLFGWFRSQTPWVITPVIDPNGTHGRTVRSDWYYVAEQEQLDPHETLCNICETLIAISPESEAAASDAINPQGRPITVGDHRPWSKNMPRHNIPAKTRVAWNVAFRQILLARSASESLTDYARKMAELVRRTEKVFRFFTEKWIKGKSISNADSLTVEINEIVQAVNALSYAAPETPTSEMTTPAQGAGNDESLGALLTGVLGNLLSRMSRIPSEERAKGPATFAGTLAAQAREHGRSTIWRTCAEPPLRELDALAKRLGDIACILHEMAHDGGQPSTQGIVKAARNGNLGKAIHAAALRCRSLADQRFHRRLRALEGTLKQKGWNARCWSRPVNEADSVYWPAREVAVLIEITDFEADAQYIEDALAMGQRHLENDWRFRVVPVINGYVLPTLALLPSSHTPLPDHDFAEAWKEHINRPFFSSQIVDRFDEALAACNQLSGILSCRDFENLHAKEKRAFSQALESFEHNRDLVAEVAESTGSAHLAWARNYLNETWDQIAREFESATAGHPVTQPLSLNAHLALAGQANDQTMELAAVRIFLLQAESMSAVEPTCVPPSGAS